MKKIFLFCMLTFLITLFSAQSIIIEVEGKATMGDDKSRKETIEEAKTNAKKMASEVAGTYVKSETVVKNYVTEADLMEAYSQAVVRILEELKSEWFQDPIMGESFKITLKVEVTPKTEKLEKMYSSTGIMDDPNAPLMIKAWCDKKDQKYKENENIKLYIKGNKPFYAKVVYLQVDGTQIQLLPNPFRKDNYFNGGTVYGLPSGKDRYELTVAPPFGTEKIVVYASTDELGTSTTQDAESVYVIEDSYKDTGVKTRGIKINKKKKSMSNAAEFCEEEIEIITSK
ncbi:MAG: DUF4384 domain-containing protein [Candidatus Delongbacteria bacterium]|nr:DUF4384 domain-containing protein [Candidatus Delongbacteria bacterium]